MPRAFRPVLLASILVSCLAATLAAQTNTGNVYGNVIDEQGMKIPGGTATLIGPAAPRTTSVDANGFFRFLNVAPGKYAVTVTMPGFTTVTRENVNVSVGQNTQVDVQLKLSNVQEAVTVTSQIPLIDTRKVETGQTFTKEELTEIPTSRDVWSLIQQVPGVQLSTVNVAGAESAIVGGPGFITKGSGNVAYQVDGATITNNTYGSPLGRQNGGTDTYFDFSTFENVEVATGGGLLEQQNSGVTINVVTKRGTNDLKGSARYIYASANWQSNNQPQEAIDEGLYTNNTRFIREYGADLGGPILKDRLWLWAAGSRQDISTNPATLGSLPYPQTVTLEPWSAKLNVQISNPNAAALYFNRSYRVEDGRGAGADRPPLTRTNLTMPTNFYKIEDSNVFSADLFGSVFASYQNSNYTDTPEGGLAPECRPPFDLPPEGCRQWGYRDGSYQETWRYWFAKDPLKQANLQVSKFFNTGKLNHELKFSFNYRQQTADSATGIPGDQLWGREYTPSSATALISRGVRTVYQTQYWSGTLGDTLTAGNLTVQAGLRLDIQQAKNLPSRSFANYYFPTACTGCGADGGSFPGLPEALYHGADSWQFEYTNWQPRVSATYALGEKKSTLLRASYAQFADQLGYIVWYGNGTPQNNGYYYYWSDANHDHKVQPGEILFDQPYGTYRGIDPATLPNIPNQLQPGFKTPLTNEVTAGIDQQLSESFAVSATFSYRSTTNLQEAVPLGSSLSTYDPGGIATGTATGRDGFTIDFAEPYFDLNLAAPPGGQEFRNRPGASQRYYGVDVSAVKRLSDRWSVRGNFGWSSFKQYITPASIQNPNNLWELGGQNDNGALALGASGKGSVFLNGSWQFNVSGLYQGPWGVVLGANLFGRQGYPNPYYVRVYTSDVAFTRANILIGQVDTYRYPNVYELDMRLEKTFQIGPVQVIPAVELFNVANGGAVLQRYQQTGIYRDGVFTQDGPFNQILELQSPRIVRMGLRVNF
jgi:hypothetical protein